MSTSNILKMIAAFGSLMSLLVTPTRAEMIVKNFAVPEGATLSYSVGDRVIQSIPVAPGSYRVTIETIEGGGGGRRAPKFRGRRR